MTKQELIEAIEALPEDAEIFINTGAVNLLEAEDIDYDANSNIIVIG